MCPTSCKLNFVKDLLVRKFSLFLALFDFAFVKRNKKASAMFFIAAVNWLAWVAIVFLTFLNPSLEPILFLLIMLALLMVQFSELWVKLSWQLAIQITMMAYVVYRLV